MSANPVELIGGIVNTSNVPKADIVAWAKARVPQVMADASEVNNTDLASQKVIYVLSLSSDFYYDSTDTTTADDAGVTCLVSHDGKRFKRNAQTQITINGTSAAKPALSINPKANSLGQGINLLQSLAGASSSNIANQFVVNDFTTGANNFYYYFNSFVNAAGWTGQKIALNTGITVVGDAGIGSNEVVALGAVAVGFGNVSHAVDLFASNFSVTANGTGYGNLVGCEYDINAGTATSAVAIIGCQVVLTGAYSGSSNSTGYYVGTTTSATWLNGYGWYANAFNTNSTIIGSTNATPAKYGVDFNTVTGNAAGFAWRGPSATSTIDWSGNVLLKFNTGTPPTRAFNGLQIAGVDGSQAGIEIDTFGSTNGNALFIRANGTAASPTQLTTDNNIGQFAARGYHSGNAYSGNQATLRFASGESWTSTARGAYVTVSTTPNGSVTLAEAARFFGSTGFSVGSTTDPGAGVINAANGYKTAGTQVVGAHITGYTAMTGSPDKATAYATSTVTLAQLAGRVAQLQADLTTHGLIGT